MRRSLCVAVFIALMVALLPARASAAESCDDANFAARLQCWSRAIEAGNVVLVTLDGELSYNGKASERRTAEQALWKNRERLVVEVPRGRSTGEGGTALLLLASTGWIAQDTTIDKLSDAALSDLKSLAVCGDTAPAGSRLKGVCDRLADGPLSGEQLIAAAPDTFRAQQSHSVATSEGSGPGLLLIVMSALLVVLLTALVFVIRRSSRAAPHRALAVAGGGTVPTTNSATPDERTTRLRVPPTPQHGRRVGHAKGPAKSAVVRTELHPQGYVELDRVLHRAVWAEPGRPPPAPGQLVDVTDAREGDSDVLYAFPPTAGRHAKGTRP